MGEGHTSHSTHNKPAGGKRKRTGRRQKEGEKEEEESAFERCFQLLDKGPRFVRTTRREKAQQQKRKTKGAHNLPCLLSGSEAEGMRLKALGLLPKKPFYFQKKIKGLETNCETRGLGAEVSL